MRKRHLTSRTLHHVVRPEMAVPPASPPPPGEDPNQRHPWDEPQVPDDRFSRAWASAKRPRQLRYWTDSPAAIAPSGLANLFVQRQFPATRPNLQADRRSFVAAERGDEPTHNRWCRRPSHAHMTVSPGLSPVPARGMALRLTLPDDSCHGQLEFRVRRQGQRCNHHARHWTLFIIVAECRSC